MKSSFGSLSRRGSATCTSTPPAGRSRLLALVPANLLTAMAFATAAVAGCSARAPSSTGTAREPAPHDSGPIAAAPADSASASPTSDPTTADAPTAGKATTYVLATGTVYYNGDPLRGHRPDGTLRRGTKVALVRRVNNFSVVRTEEGVEAYVATHTLEPLAMQ